MIRFNHIAAAAVLVSAVAGWTTGGYASSTVQVSRTVYDLSDAPDLAKGVKAVCANKSLNLSDKAKAACATEKFPSVTKALKFRNAGIGAEFNTLIANQK